MLYYINESIGDKVKNGDTFTISILIELLEAWKRNKCIIDAKRKTFEAICSNSQLEGYKGPSLRKQGLRSIYKNLSFFVQLASEDDKNVKTFDGATGRLLTISSCHDVYYFSHNALICENSHDYVFYLWLADYFQRKEIKDSISLHTSRANGGGSQTEYECYLYDVDKKNALVIYDSDQKYPNDSIGQTAHSIENRIASLNSSYLWNHKLSVHEIENLIPVDVLVRLKKKSHKTFLAKMGANRNNPSFERLFKYFDFKKGLLPSTLRAYKHNLSTNEFNELIDLLLKLGANQRNIDKALSRRYDIKANENVILGGWGEKLLQASVDYVYSNYATYTLSPFQEQEVQSLIKDIWSIGCVQRKSII